MLIFVKINLSFRRRQLNFLLYGQSGELFPVGRSVSKITIILSTSKKKNIDHRSRETCDHESDLISLLRDSTMSGVLNFYFLSTLLQPKRKIY